MKLDKSIRLYFLLGFLIISTDKAFAVEPITINAEKFRVDGRQQLVMAEDKVEVVQGKLRVVGNKAIYKQKEREIQISGDVRLSWPDMVLTCEEIIIYGSEDKILARNQISFTYKDIRATSEEAVFYAKEDKLVLEGVPKAWQNKDYLTGDRILVWLKEKRMIIEGRTKVIISPERWLPQ